MSGNPARNASGSSILRGMIGSGITSGSGVGAGSGVAVGAGAGVGAGSGEAVVSGVGLETGVAVVSDVGLETGVAAGSDVGLGTGVAAGAGVFVRTGVGAGLVQANSAATVTRTAKCSSFDMLDLLHPKILSSIVIQPASGDASQTYREYAISRGKAAGGQGSTPFRKGQWDYVAHRREFCANVRDAAAVLEVHFAKKAAVANLGPAGVAGVTVPAGDGSLPVAASHGAFAPRPGPRGGTDPRGRPGGWAVAAAGPSCSARPSPWPPGRPVMGRFICQSPPPPSSC